MMKTNLLWFVLIVAGHLESQMTISVISTPQLTPLFDSIYVAGTFNNWNPSDENFKLTENGKVWSTTISGNDGDNIEFKFTRGGGWSTVEGDALGAYIANRTATFQNGSSLELTIEGWEDIAGIHTVTENVRIVDSNFPMPQLGRQRRIWIYLPDDYTDSNNYYPVLYMHDGQNVFDAATSFAGEWHVDETLADDLAGWCEQAIVVGIDNGGVHRIDEYSPWVNTGYNEGGEGEQYATWLVQTLKPFIDENFRTLPDRDNTGTAGSSLGALISMYLVTQHNNVFSKGAIFSPAFWFNEEIFDFVQNNPFASATQLYFHCGDSESDLMVPDMQQMIAIVENNGSINTSIQDGVTAGGEHNEYFWSIYFHSAFTFLYDCVSQVEGYALPLIYSFPNPASDSINIRVADGRIIHSATIKTVSGQIVRVEENINAPSFNTAIADLSFGWYVVEVVCDSGSVYQSLKVECGFVPFVKE